jgi:hypothetical protein
MAILRWPVLLPGLAAALVLAAIATYQRPPAPEVASRCVAVAAILLLAKVIAWVIADGARFEREQRLAVAVSVFAVLGGWYAALSSIAQAEFDYRVMVQQDALEESCRALSRELLAFVDGRTRAAPVSPRAASWNRDEAQWLAFERTTAALYEERFDRRVRMAHDLLSLRDLRDRDLDACYRSVANTFQMTIVARRLATLADRLHAERRLPLTIF